MISYSGYVIFLDSLCREEDISDTFYSKEALYYQTHCEAKNHKNMIVFLQRFSCLLSLLPFKPIAKTDLIAIYRLFEILLIKKNDEEKIFLFCIYQAY